MAERMDSEIAYVWGPCWKSSVSWIRNRRT